MSTREEGESLLEAFPTPPSFVPANPPPTAPPSQPLPPLPYSTRRPGSPDISTLMRGTPRRASRVTDDPDLEYSDSDSSIDLSTPLPNLMLKHGFLSHRSNLLSTPASNSLSDSSSFRPDSVLSVADSAITKSGLLKDGRDTVKRRKRHRDGRTLKGGIGLTTGLGWSDSEDEDAPSALTKRISSLKLSSRHSTPSLRSQRSSSATTLSSSHSSSFSSTTLSSSSYSLSAFDGDTTDDDFVAHTYTGRKTPKHNQPPTSWNRNLPHSSTPRFYRSTSSSSSLSLRIPDRPIKLDQNSVVRTPSSSSSQSILLPVTPLDDFDPPSTVTTVQSPVGDRNKTLPSLPKPKSAAIRKYQSTMNLNSTPKPISAPPDASSTPQLRKRSGSSTSSSGSGSGSCEGKSTIPMPSRPSLPSSSSLPRTLRLPTRSFSTPKDHRPQSEEAAPTLPTTSLRFSQQRSALRSAPTTPSAAGFSAPPSILKPRASEPMIYVPPPSSRPINSSISPAPAGIPVPRTPRTQGPRIGTGMTYRTSGIPAQPVARERIHMGIAI